MDQKKLKKILLTMWYLPLNFGYFKSPLALLEPNGTHFSQWIVKIQMFLSNFHLFDFTGNRRLLAVFGVCFEVFWLSAVSLFFKTSFRAKEVCFARPRHQNNNNKQSELATARSPIRSPIFKNCQFRSIQVICNQNMWICKSHLKNLKNVSRIGKIVHSARARLGARVF